MRSDANKGGLGETEKSSSAVKGRKPKQGKARKETKSKGHGNGKETDESDGDETAAGEEGEGKTATARPKRQPVISKEMHENGMCRMMGCHCKDKASAKDLNNAIGEDTDSKEGSDESETDDSDKESGEESASDGEEENEESCEGADCFADAILPIPATLRQSYELICMKVLRAEAWYEVRRKSKNRSSCRV